MRDEGSEVGGADSVLELSKDLCRLAAGGARQPGLLLRRAFYATTGFWNPCRRGIGMGARTRNVAHFENK